MIDKTVNYLQDIELLEKIEPIAERMGLEADDVIERHMPHVIGVAKEYSITYKDKTYTSSSLELLLPECCFGEAETILDEIRMKVNEIVWELILDLIIECQTSRGKQKVEALARLIILLDEEGLLKCQ